MDIQLNAQIEATNREKVAEYVLTTYGAGERFTKKDVAAGAEVSDNSALKVLGQLVETKQLCAEGEKRHRKYFLPDDRGEKGAKE
ncbi:hypothetical protein FACS1894216_22190 [Synergistales bacterium]|nr:hypothetical protein FACS1894216_22190 [Synergistales bacterium]